MFLFPNTFEEGYHMVPVQTAGICIVWVKAAERRRHLERSTLSWVCGDQLVIVKAVKVVGVIGRNVNWFELLIYIRCYPVLSSLQHESVGHCSSTVELSWGCASGERLRSAWAILVHHQVLAVIRKLGRAWYDQPVVTRPYLVDTAWYFLIYIYHKLKLF